MSRHGMAVSVLFASVVLLVSASVCPVAEGAQSRLPLASPDTIAVVRVKSIDAFIKSVIDLAGQFEPGAAPMMQQQVNAMLLGLPGVDRNGPAALLILDPKKFDDPAVGLFTLKDPAQFKTVKLAQVEVVGNIGLIAEDQIALAQAAQMVKNAAVKTIPTGDMTGMVAAAVDVGGLLRRYKADIQGLLQIAKLQLGGGMRGMEPAPPNPTQTMALKALDYLIKGINELEKQAGLVQVEATLGKDLIKVTSFFEATPGSDFARFLAKNRLPANRAVANYLPRGAWMTSIASYDPASYAEAYVGMLRIGWDILGLKKTEADAISKALEDWLKNLTGLQAGAGVASKDGGYGGVGLYGMKDRAAARQHTKALVALTGTGTVGNFLKKYGITAALKEKHREHLGVPIDQVEVAFDLDKLLGAIPMPIPPDARPMMKQQLSQMLKMSYGHSDKIVGELAYGSKLMVMAYGPSVQDTMNQQVALIKSGGADGIGNVGWYKTALNAHPSKSFAVGHLSLFSYLETVTTMMAKATPDAGMVMGMFPKRSELPKDETPITSSARVEGNRCVMDVLVPMKPIRDIVDAVKKKMGGMMAPPPPGGRVDEF